MPCMHLGEAVNVKNTVKATCGAWDMSMQQLCVRKGKHDLSRGLMHAMRPAECGTACIVVKTSSMLYDVHQLTSNTRNLNIDVDVMSLAFVGDSKLHSKDWPYVQPC